MTRPWSHLYPVQTENLDKKTAREAAALNERISELQAEREQVDRLKNDFRNGSSLDQPGPHWSGLVEVIRAARAKAILTEIALRQDIGALLDGPHHDAMTAAADSAEESHRREQQRVEQALLDLGYDARDPALTPTAARHPGVHHAREAARSARAQASDRGRIQANKTALDAARAEIEQARQKAVA